jgi:hypothetical protein
MQVRDTLDRGHFVSNRHTQHVAQVSGRVGGQQERAIALAGQPDSRDARGDGFADATFAGKEYGPAVAVGGDKRLHIRHWVGLTWLARPGSISW